MESDDSNPGSSASNSSSNSSENSRSSPEPSIEPQTANALHMQATGEIESRSRPNSRCSNDGANSPHSSSKSDFNSSSSSSSSDNENDGIKSPMENSSAKRSRTTSPQPTKSQRSSRHSSLSSNNSSRSNSANSNFRNGGADISHEDLSDVSEMESEKRSSVVNNSKQSIEDEATNASATSAQPDKESNQVENNSLRRFSLETDNSQNAVITDLRKKLDQIKTLGKTTEVPKDTAVDGSNENEKQIDPIEDLVKPNDEDALDFEAEEGECQDISKDDEKVEDEQQTSNENEKLKSDGEAEAGEELEEGEVTDEDEKRPEETEPKPVCRFYTRGQCTWGMSCRFLHPGVTDKGNYTMFDLVRPVPVTQTGPVAARPPNYAAHPIDFHEFRTERPVIHHRLGIPSTPSVFGAHHDPRAAVADGPVVIESAWERGLRTAKEMMRKANKRKEQDMDFEDKKMNLTLSPDEIEKDAYYLKERASPQDIPPPYARHPLYQEPIGMYSPTERFARGPPLPSPYDDIDSYGRTTRYRELPPHRMPQYEDERRVRPTREVIVQRVEPVGRGDEWRDPWMRSPGGRGDSRGHSGKRRHDRRSYSSNSSYSSSSSSRSDSSSESSRSSTPAGRRRRYNSSHKVSPVRRHGTRSARSPSLSRRPRHSSSGRHSPAVKRKGTNSPTMDKRGGYSPMHKRKKLSSTAKRMDKTKSRHRVSSSSSGSGSSDSSDSDSDSGSSSSDSSSISRERTNIKRSRTTEKLAHERRNAKKAEPAKKRSPISIEIKKQPTVGVSALASSPTHSINSDKDMKKSRREELLKQLRAVEDAIAKKRSKLN
ncbi:zinc finger CCCH domain-containing protein 18 [Eurosta solidaginis]|uniref:zinc finger CCCH domain-containing protein 18 n=1 Tax=Eurosta solidaginis TaxID=178769 RepID=UPI0035311960